MKILSFVLFLALATTLSAAPRKVGGLSFPKDDAKAPQADLSLQQDAIAQKEQEAAAAIRMESQDGPSLLQRRNGETYTEYKERMEAARERLKNDTVRSEELKESQQEAIYEALYQMRKDEFGGSGGRSNGTGAGPWGIQYQAPLELNRVIDEIEELNKETTPAATASSGQSEAVAEEAPAPEQEREEGSEPQP